MGPVRSYGLFEGNDAFAILEISTDRGGVLGRLELDGSGDGRHRDSLG